MAGIAGVQCGLDLPEIHRQALDTQRRPGSRLEAVQVDADAALHVEIGRNRAVVQQFVVAVGHRALAVHVVAALRLKPKLVVVVADPGLPVPAEIRPVAEPAFELVEEPVDVDPVVRDRIAERGGALQRIRAEPTPE
jgi:hypothetical protein